MPDSVIDVLEKISIALESGEIIKTTFESSGRLSLLLYGAVKLATCKPVLDYFRSFKKQEIEMVRKFADNHKKISSHEYIWFRVMKPQAVRQILFNNMCKSSNDLFTVEKYQLIQLEGTNKDFFNAVENRFLDEDCVNQSTILSFLKRRSKRYEIVCNEKVSKNYFPGTHGHNCEQITGMTLHCVVNE
jgi:hypothetical protein